MAADRLTVIRHGGRWAAVLMVTAVGGAALQLLLPYALGRTLDALVSGVPPRHTWLPWCLLLILGIVACQSLGVRAAGSTGAQAAAWLRGRLVSSMLGAGPALTRRFSEGDLVTRFELNAEEAGQAPAALIGATALLLPTVGGLVALALIDIWMAATLLAGLSLVGFVLRGFLRDTTAIAGGYQRAQSDIAGRLVDALRGARTIAAADTAEQETRRVLAPLPGLRTYGLALWRANARAGVRAGLAVPALELAVLAVGGLRLASGGLTVGGLYAAARYAVLGAGLSSALGSISSLARARSATARLADLLAQPAVRYGAGPLPPGPGTLEFRAVRLPDREHLIDLTVPGGACVAVVGRSGAGKSLLAAVAGRLAEPAAGTVALDGVDLPELSREALRSAVSFAFERPVLVGATVGEAIGLGRPEFGPQAIEAAAEAARADGFIRPLPQGYATPLEDAPMSGGERQRIGLARAFAHGDRLLILDDATSSLDTVTERQVAAALTGELGGRTRLVIAHRAATAARADRVIWLEDGGVRGYDRHAVLWRDPEYRAVFAEDGP